MSRRIFEYSEEDIKNRFVDHWCFAENFIDAYLSDEDFIVEVKLNVRRLYLSISSAYQDIARYKNYHQNNPWDEKLDYTKRCAYFMKWIPRFKPIQIFYKDEADINNWSIDELEFLNELFSIYLFELHLSDEIGRDVALSEKKIKDLTYDLLYRNISVDGWIAIFQLIKELSISDAIDYVPFLDLE